MTTLTGHSTALPSTRTVGLWLALMLLTVAPLWAQEATQPDLFAGASALRDLGTDDIPAVDYDRGWLVAAGVPLGVWRLAAVGEVGQNSRTNVVGETQRLFAGLGGVRVNLLRSRRVDVFGQALLGIERFSEPGFDQSGLAIQPGAGVNIWLWSRLGARAQLDWRLSEQNGDRYRELRLAAGVVVRLGG